MASRADAFRWLDDNRDRLDAAAQYAVIHGYPGYATLIPALIHEYLVERGHWDQARNLHRRALNAAGDDDLAAKARALFGLGALRFETGEIAAAFGSQSAAREVFAELDEPVGEAQALCFLGDIHRERGNFDEAFREITAAIGLFGDDKWQVAGARYYLGIALRAAGQPRHARNLTPPSGFTARTATDSMRPASSTKSDCCKRRSDSTPRRRRASAKRWTCTRSTAARTECSRCSTAWASWP